jgi:Ca2+-binding EF-hand superfamily protein
MFERRDENADGKLTGEEISDRMRENLEAIDADKDGAVTLEEFQQGMQSMFANRGAGGGGRPGGGGFGGDPREGKPDRPQRPE